MEVIAVLLIILFSIIFLKILALMFHVGIFMLTLPFKLLAVLVSVLLVVFVLIPIGVVGGLVGLILLPLTILIPILPLALILMGLYFLLKKS